MTAAKHIVLQLWLVIVATLAHVSDASAFTSENRAWKNFPSAVETRPAIAAQLPQPHQENAFAAYDFALESLLAAKTGGVESRAIVRYFPANNGFLGATEKQFLMPGQVIDRYGGSGYSRFFSPAGTSEAARALPAGSAGQQLRSFEVLKPFEVDAGTVAPAFGQLGLGEQFVTPVKLEILLKRGILRETTR